MKHVIPHMVAQGGGSIINISSLAGIRWTGVPYSTYYSSKAALNHLSRTTAAEYASKHVRVNAILPGLMETPMVTESAELAGAYADGQREEMLRKRHAQVPMGHMGTAWDVANAAVFLASDESALRHGHRTARGRRHFAGDLNRATRGQTRPIPERLNRPYLTPRCLWWRSGCRVRCSRCRNRGRS